MINTEKLKSLNEDEEVLLLYSLNNFCNPLISGEVDYQTIASYNYGYLHHILKNEITPKLNPTGEILMSGIINKLFN